MIRAATVADAEAIARVHMQAWAETYAGIVPPEVLSRWSVADRTARWQSILSGDLPSPHRAEVAVVEACGAIAGFASWGEQRDDALRAQGYAGEVSALYLLRGVQGQGHGRALMVRAARGLVARGHGGGAAWVFSANVPARRFYERLGGVAVAEQPFEIEGASLLETAYAWTSLATLATASDTIGVGSSQ